MANGVAVYPTYDAIGNLLNIARILLLIEVGVAPALAVFIDALSASSSIIRILLESITPFYVNSD